ncbi:TIGR02530 family flagellar biosynthesis protein [Alkalibacillus haloalkaliphilus]|uniref:TIGR02530 family flagellar biosynthesis protein n=1 Tax=Alkalibacillus haloalkaliphilus TaxID=94136 RepID=UPI0002E208C2|nr:TIGR02530 family flagellar biosynthesis protein [Alkalibacillus haloalkaliphilus]
MNKINPGLHQQPLSITNANTKPKSKPVQGESFKTVFENVSNEGVKVSKHAQKRMDERNIQISEKQWEQIEQKMTEAKEKGVTDSAVVLSDAILLASTKNETIITAMDRQEATGHLFTNVNGTIVL